MRFCRKKRVVESVIFSATLSPLYLRCRSAADHCVKGLSASSYSAWYLPSSAACRPGRVHIFRKVFLK